MDRDKTRLHICLGTQCNNNCLFCMEEDRDGRSQRLARIDEQTAVRIMTQAAGRDEVMFTAGEPTLRNDLSVLVGHAVRLGYARVGLVTNARRLAYARYLDELLAAGLNHVLVSVHGHTARLHDGLTRAPGAFDQVAAGLANIARVISRRARLRFGITCVLNKRNLPFVADMLRFYRSFSPDEIVFNAVQPLGRGQRHFERLVPTYTEMVRGFARGLDELGRSPGEVRLLDVPLCMTVALPQGSVGYVEQHSHYEPETEVLDELTGATPSHTDGRAGELTLVTKDDLDRVLRKKGPECPKCIYCGACEGVWRVYVEHYGFEEFRPVIKAQE